MIGCWGSDVVFEVSDSRVFTFSDFQRTVSAEYAEHNRIGGRAELELLYPNPQEIKFTMILDATFGVKPRSTLELLELSCETGRVNPLIIGEKRVGKNNWVITSIDEEWDVIYSMGEVARVNVDVSMREYV